MGKSSFERRRYPRFPVFYPALLTDGDAKGEIRGQTLDVSRGGALIVFARTDAPSVGSTIQIELSMPGPLTGPGEPLAVSRTAKVLRHQPAGGSDKTGVALQFVQPLEADPED